MTVKNDLDKKIVTLDLESKIRKRPGRFVLYREVALRARRSKDWLVEGLLGVGEASAYYGAPGDGKSVLVEDLGLHVAAGRAWFGRKVKRGAVVCFALERKALVERRALAFQLEHNVMDIPFAVCGGGGFLDFRDPNICERIIEVIKSTEEETGDKVVLIIIDTLSRALCGADENSSKDMGAVVRATSILQEDGARHILWIHHTPHGADRLRGHGNLEGALDTAIHVTHDRSSSIRRATVTKANDSEEGEQIAFFLKSVTINPDDNTTAPVVLPVENAPKSKTKNKTKSFATLRKIILDLATETRTPYADDPLMRVKAAKISDVRTEHYRQHVSRDGDSDPKKLQGAKQRSFHRDVTGAQKAGLIMVRDEYVWLIA